MWLLHRFFLKYQAGCRCHPRPKEQAEREEVFVLIVLPFCGIVYKKAVRHLEVIKEERKVEYSELIYDLKSVFP